jgi:hypothetical protein
MTIKPLDNPCRDCCMGCDKDKNACESRKERRRAIDRSIYKARKGHGK